MTSNLRPLQFRDYLPDVFRTGEVNGHSVFSAFLQGFETVYEELQAAIEGVPGGPLELTVIAVNGATVTVEPFHSRAIPFPEGTTVIAPASNRRTTLAETIPEAIEGATTIIVADADFGLTPGDVLWVQPGGVPELFNPATTPPAQLLHRQPSEMAYLHELADWLGLPLRADKSVAFNREFFQTAIAWSAQRGTLPGLEALLRAWLKGDLLESTPPVHIMTDLTRTHTDVDTVFQLDETATLGLDTVLGEGPPFFFIVDLITNPEVPDLSLPEGLENIRRAAQLLLDNEKPAHTTYELRVRPPSS